MRNGDFQKFAPLYVRYSSGFGELSPIFSAGFLEKTQNHHKQKTSRAELVKISSPPIWRKITFLEIGLRFGDRG